MGVHSRVSDLREQGEEPPDDLVSGGEVTPSFLQNVPGYTDHHCLMWEGVCRSLNTRRTAGKCVLCPSPYPGAGGWMRDVVVRRTCGWTLKFSRSPLGRRHGSGLWSKSSSLPSYSSPVSFSSFVSVISSILLALEMPILEQNIISVQMILDSACRTLKPQTQRKVFYIKSREAGRIGLSDIPSDSKEMLLAGERTEERPQKPVRSKRKCCCLWCFLGFNRTRDKRISHLLQENVALLHVLVPQLWHRSQKETPSLKGRLTIAKSCKPEMLGGQQEKYLKLNLCSLMPEDHCFRVLSLEKILGGVATTDINEVFHVP